MTYKKLTLLLTILFSFLSSNAFAKDLGITQQIFETRFSDIVQSYRLDPDEKEILANLVFSPRDENGDSSATIGDVKIITNDKNKDGVLDLARISYNSFKGEALSDYATASTMAFTQAICGEVVSDSDDLSYVSNTAQTRNSGSRSKIIFGFKITNMVLPQIKYKQQLEIKNVSNNNPEKTRKLKTKKREYVDYFG